MRRTPEEAERTRQAVLEAALEEFSERGYARTRLSDVAQRAGATRGAIYHHFRDKADLYEQLLQEASQLEAEVVRRAMQEGGNFEEVCRRILVRGMDLLWDDKRYRRIVRLLLFERSPSGRTAERARAFVDGLAQSMQGGIESGTARADLDPKALAHAFLAFQNGVALLWLGNDRFFDLRAQSEDLADVFLHGLIAR